MSDALELRPAAAEDLSWLFELYCMVFRSHIEKIWGWSESWQRANFSHDFDSSSTSVVELDGRSVGYVQTDREEQRLYLRSIALHPDVQGQGTGTLLIGQLQQESKERGVPLELVLFRTNPRAREFYKRLGFKQTGQADAFIEMSWHAA